MSQPNFFIVGASKCGTSAIAGALGKHPNICMSDIKEPNFFNQYSFSSSTEIPSAELKRYLLHFDHAAGENVVGEASVSYLSSKNAAERLYSYNPAAKILILIRNPIERTRSLFEMYSRHGYKGTFQEAAISDGFLSRQVLYYEKINSFLSIFSSDQVMILDHADLKSNWKVSMHKVLSFLNVDPEIKISRIEKNIGGLPKNKFYRYVTSRSAVLFVKAILPKVLWKSADKVVKKYMHKNLTITEEQYSFLKNFYRNDTEKLSKLLGRDLMSSWLNE
jgi:hypothetical protein